MMERPAFKPHIRVAALSGEGVFLLTERGYRVLRGRLFELVAPLIDGQRREEDLVEELRREVSAAEVFYVLELLEKKGLLLESRERGSPDMTAFWTARGFDPDAADRRLQESRVSLTALGGVPLGEIRAVLESMQIRAGADGELGLVLVDEYLNPDLEASNREALERRRPWMLLKPVGEEFFLGPIFVPGKTGCWRCLRDRYSLNRPVEQFLLTRSVRTSQVPFSARPVPGVLQVALHMAALEVARWIVGEGNPDLEGKVISVDSRSWRMSSHTLVRRSGCPACGPPAHPTGTTLFVPVQLRSRKIAFTRDGGYRTVMPEETLKQYEHLVSPITGVVNLLQRAEFAARPLHVYLAAWGHGSLHREPVSIASLKSNPRDIGLGKGFSDSQARASGLCEALERYSAVFEGCEPRITARMGELGKDAVVPNESMLFSRRQYREREQHNVGRPKHHQVPEPFDESSAIEWSPVWSLTHRTVKYLPTQYLYFRYLPGDAEKAPECFPACSNGNASGNTIEEAILQGFLELVERDSVALWWYNMVRRPAVDPASFDEAGFMEFADCYQRLNRRVWILDITSDLGIPAFAALSRRTEHHKQQILMGFGCHLEARVAVQRALAEMNQSLQFISRNQCPSAQDLGDSGIAEWLETATCENQPYLNPDEALGIRRRSDYPKVTDDDLLDLILKCQKIVEQRGMEMLVLDQTRPDIGLPVVKVIVPGLRHFWPRFAPGRLYDEPLKMGWLKERRKEEELNPIPMFL